MYMYTCNIVYICSILYWFSITGDEINNGNPCNVDISTQTTRKLLIIVNCYEQPVHSYEQLNSYTYIYVHNIHNNNILYERMVSYKMQDMVCSISTFVNGSYIVYYMHIRIMTKASMLCGTSTTLVEDGRFSVMQNKNMYTVKKTRRQLIEQLQLQYA